MRGEGRNEARILRQPRAEMTVAQLAAVQALSASGTAPGRVGWHALSKRAAPNLSARRLPGNLDLHVLP